MYSIVEFKVFCTGHLDEMVSERCMMVFISENNQQQFHLWL